MPAYLVTLAILLLFLKRKKEKLPMMAAFLFKNILQKN